MIIPDKNQWRGWVALALIQALLVWLDAPLALNWGLLAAWLMLLMASALLLWREKPDFRINRDYGAVQQSAQPFTMQLALHNAVPRDLALHLFDHYPPQAESSAMPQRAPLGTDERLTLAYPLTIHARGRFRFTALQLRYPDRLALWQRDLRLDAPADVRVYPRFAHDHADSAFAGIHTPQLGHVHPLYKRGGNGDFSHLRDYQDGDSINRLDWNNLKVYPQVFKYYSGLIHLRKAHPAFHMGNADLVRRHLEFLPTQDCLVAFCLKNHAGGDRWNDIYVVLNANKELRTVKIPKGKYTIVCANGEVNETGLGEMEGGEVMVDGQSALILHN